MFGWRLVLDLTRLEAGVALLTVFAECRAACNLTMARRLGYIHHSRHTRPAQFIKSW